MAATVNVYGPAMQSALTGSLDCGALGLALFTGAGGVFNEDHDEFADLSDEHATANGYTAGGKPLTGEVVNYAAGISTLDADNVVWTATGSLTAKYAVLYDGVTGKLLLHINLNGGADVTATDADFTVAWNVAGILKIDVSP